MKYKINFDFDCLKSQAIFEVDHRFTEFESWDVMFLVRGTGKTRRVEEYSTNTWV